MGKVSWRSGILADICQGEAAPLQGRYGRAVDASRPGQLGLTEAAGFRAACIPARPSARPPPPDSPPNDGSQNHALRGRCDGCRHPPPGQRGRLVGRRAEWRSFLHVPGTRSHGGDDRHGAGAPRGERRRRGVERRGGREPHGDPRDRRRSSTRGRGDGDVDAATPSFLAAIHAADAAVKLRGSERGFEGMGATLSLLCIGARNALWGQAGDSRIYICRRGKLRQISRDHSPVGRMRQRGEITEAEARRHPSRNQIDQSLGNNEAEFVPEMGGEEVHPGDVFLVCSDGLSDGLWDHEIEVLLGAVRAPLDVRPAARQQLVSVGRWNGVRARQHHRGRRPRLRPDVGDLARRPPRSRVPSGPASSTRAGRAAPPPPTRRQEIRRPGHRRRPHDARPNSWTSTARLVLSATVRKGAAKSERVLLRSAAGRRRIALTPAQAAILTECFTGPGTAPEGLAVLLAEHRCPPLDEYYELVLQAHAAGVLVEEGSAEKAAVAGPCRWPLRLPRPPRGRRGNCASDRPFLLAGVIAPPHPAAGARRQAGRTGSPGGSLPRARS